MVTISPLSLLRGKDRERTELQGFRSDSTPWRREIGELEEKRERVSKEGKMDV